MLVIEPAPATLLVKLIFIAGFPIASAVPIRVGAAETLLNWCESAWPSFFVCLTVYLPKFPAFFYGIMMPTFPEMIM
jgi:hypothetical protein